jgi:hypothetical protein
VPTGSTYRESTLPSASGRRTDSLARSLYHGPTVRSQRHTNSHWQPTGCFPGPRQRHMPEEPRRASRPLVPRSIKVGTRPPGQNWIVGEEPTSVNTKITRNRRRIVVNRGRRRNQVASTGTSLRQRLATSALVGPAPSIELRGCSKVRRGNRSLSSWRREKRDDWARRRS